MLPTTTAPTGRALLRLAVAGSTGSGRHAAAACTTNGRRVGTTTTRTTTTTTTTTSDEPCDIHCTNLLARHTSNSRRSGRDSRGSGEGGQSAWSLSAPSTAAAAAAAAASAIVYAQQRAREREEDVCLCKGKISEKDSLQDYARRLQRLRSLRDIFEEYATVNADDVGQLMTCGDFIRSMLCYKYVRVDNRELKRRCARYLNPLLGDDHGLISFDEFCFLLSLVSIPAGLLDVAFAAADADGSGTIDVGELDRLVKRLAPPESGIGGDTVGDGDGNGNGEEQRLSGHKRLEKAWFPRKGRGGETGGGDGGKGVPREQFLAFVRDLRMDVKTVECRLYSRSIRVEEDERQPPTASRRGWREWFPSSVLGRGGTSGGRSSGSDADDGDDNGAGEEGGAAAAAAGWWSRYENDTISMADLALTLVSTCHPRDMPVFLARVQAIQKKRRQVPLRDALLLHEVLEDHAQDLEDALGMYSKASSGGAVEPADFARAAKVISGKELSPECVWLVFKIFDRGADGKLDHDELIEATRERLRRLPGQRDSPGSIARFVECARGDSVK